MNIIPIVLSTIAFFLALGAIFTVGVRWHTTSEEIQRLESIIARYVGLHCIWSKVVMMYSFSGCLNLEGLPKCFAGYQYLLSVLYM